MLVVSAFPFDLVLSKKRRYHSEVCEYLFVLDSSDQFLSRLSLLLELSIVSIQFVISVLRETYKNKPSR